MNKKETENNCIKNHIWFEIESDKKGRPTKYRCINCFIEWDVQPNPLSYKGKRSIILRRSENDKKIKLLLNQDPTDVNNKIHLKHLKQENIKLDNLLHKDLSMPK